MPTYEYHCDACEHEFEEFQPITADALKKCPQCRKLKLRRVIGAGAAVIFKGSGFYQTDYRSSEYKKAAKADKEAQSKSSESKSSDSKSSDSASKSSGGDTKSSESGASGTDGKK